jgi:nitronate monooxygenase
VSAAAFFAALPIPILQAPMVGASSTAMAIEVSRAGGLGSLGAGASGPDEIEAQAAAVRGATDAPFGINLFVVDPARPADGEVDAALARLAPWYAELGLEPPGSPNDFAPDFEAQFAALLRAKPALASFTFAPLPADKDAALKAAGILVMGTATTVAEARLWAELGADAICAQGAEAGGHRGHFLAETEASLVGTMALVATIRAAVDLPVVAAGGVMDGRGVAAALALGAAAAQMGTAFLLADETVASGRWKAAIEAAGDDPTRLTRAFSGRHARGIENRFMREMRAVEGEVPAYPVQNRLTQPMRSAAAKAGEADLMSLWAGQAVNLAPRGRSGELVRTWWEEAKAASRALADRTGA